MPAPYSIQFPNVLSHSLHGLLERGLLTPTFLSALVMAPILPKQIVTLMSSQHIPIAQDQLFETLLKRYAKPRLQLSDSSELRQDLIPQEMREQFIPMFTKIRGSYDIKISHVEGIERLELIAKPASDQYIVHCAGNSEDAMDIAGIYHRSIHNQALKGKNHVFWNYPGVEESAGLSLSVYDLFATGVNQVHILLRKGVLANNITLYGRSLGGGVASQVVKRLPKNKRPTLHIERSFSAISAVPLVAMRRLIDERPSYRPFYSAVLVTSFLGISLGFITAGAVATVGLLCASAVAALGYMLASFLQLCRHGVAFLFCLRAPGLLEKLDELIQAVHTRISKFALMLHQHIFNTLATILGVLVLPLGLIIGSILGVGIGAVLSLQLLFTDTPSLYFPLFHAMRLLTFVAHAEMDSVAAIYSILEDSEQPPVIVTSNTEDDEVIPVNAALNTGLQYGPRTDDSSELFHPAIHYFWYKKGGHNEEMRELGRSYLPG